MLFTIVAIVVALMSVSIHELGHAFAMRQCGVGICKISLLGIPGFGTIRLPFRTRFFPGTEWRLHPLIIGAYVEPDTDDMDRLPTKDVLYVFGMGPLANVLFTLAVLLVHEVLKFTVVPPALTSSSLFASSYTRIAVMVPLLSIALVAVWRFRRFVCQFLLLPLGWLVLIRLSWFFYEVGTAGLGGISDFVRDTHDIGGRITAKLPDSFAAAAAAGLLFGGLISAIIGASNLTPLMPLDGGRMMQTLLPDKWRAAYAYVTAPVVLIMLLLQFGKDILNLGRWITRLFA